MTSAEILRRYMATISLLEDEFIQFSLEIDGRFPLKENRSALMEGPILDKIINTAKAVKSKYQDVSYSLLATMTTKAMTALDSAKRANQINAQDAGVLGKTLQRISKAGSYAAKNPKMVLMCVSMVMALVGVMHSSPANAAQTAQQLDGALGNTDQMTDALTKLSAATAKFDKAANNFYQAGSANDGSGPAIPGFPKSQAAQQVAGQVPPTQQSAAQQPVATAQPAAAPIQQPVAPTGMTMATAVAPFNVQKIPGLNTAIEQGITSQSDIDGITKGIQFNQKLISTLTGGNSNTLNQQLAAHPFPKQTGMDPNSVVDHMNAVNQYYSRAGRVAQALSRNDADAAQRYISMWK